MTARRSRKSKASKAKATTQKTFPDIDWDKFDELKENAIEASEKGLLAEAEKIYAELCAVCHGKISPAVNQRVTTDCYGRAAVYGHLDLVKFWIKHDADIFQNDGLALSNAARSNYIDIVKLLIETHEMPLDYGGNGGDALVYNACLGGAHDVLDYLFEKDIDYVRQHLDIGLMAAASNGKVHILKNIAKRGEAISDTEKLLYYAMRHGHLETALWLVLMGAKGARLDEESYSTLSADSLIQMLRTIYVQHGYHSFQEFWRNIPQHCRTEKLEEFFSGNNATFFLQSTRQARRKRRLTAGAGRVHS